MKTINLNINDQNIFFVSDTHFSHKNIIKYCNRPFSSVEEMDNAMINNWNSVVGIKDIVFIGGDFTLMGLKTWVWFLNKLNGIKYITPGNHDKKVPINIFKESSPIMNILINGDEEISDGQRITLCHYPMLSWYQSQRGAWQLYGHVHGRVLTKTTPNQLDVGVDVHNFTPIDYQSVKNLITKKNLSSI